MNAVPGQKGHLLYVHDELEKTKWLVDGGAFVSIIPPTPSQRTSGPTSTKLQAANGSKIHCFGSVTKTIKIGTQAFTYSFIIADVNQPILGADFLAEFNLAPDHREGRLLDLNSLDALPAVLAHGTENHRVNFVNEISNPYYKILDSHPGILTPTFTISEPKHGVRHHIPTNGHPVQSRARRLAPDKLAVAKAEMEKLVKLGIAYRGKSEWASPLMVATKPCKSPCTCAVSKPCGGWRVCGDYRRLNNMTQDDKYPVRTLQDFTADLHGKKIFSKIDLLKGYHQVPVAEEDIGKTAVITPFGLFIFPRTPFGLKNAGQDFQRLMDEILGDIPRTFVYIDDVLVASETPAQHVEDLEKTFTILEDNGMVVNRAKCILGQESLEFLGYKVDQNGITPLEERVSAIRQTPRPTTVKELQRFLGLVNYYRRFVPKAAQHMFHLFGALKGKPKTLPWTPDCDKSFQAIKDGLANAALLHHPRPTAPLAVTTDASKFAVGGVIEQRGPKGWEPLGFYSSKLHPHQQEWPPYDRELLAAFISVRHFRPFLEGRNFTLYTDHLSLVPSMAKKSDPQTARQTYQLSVISEYTTDIRYIQGKSNVVADALSRPPEEPIQAVEPEIPPKPVSAISEEVFHDVVAAIGPLGINLQEMARAQALDPEFLQLSRDARTGLHFKKVTLGNTNIVVDVSNGPARPFVPLPWRQKVFDALHGLGHPGVERTRQVVASKFVWPSMREDVSRWARECGPCQRAKVTRHVIPPIGDFQVPQRRFEHINLDIVILPLSNGYKYLLTAVDRFSRWPVAIPMKDISVQSVVDAFSHGWVASYGVPASITTDRGSQFQAAIWTQLMRTWGIKLHQTTAYHPESNGLVERLHRRLKEALIALGEESPTEWFWKLPCALLAIRTTLKPDLGASPADMVYGEGLAIPGELLSQPKAPMEPTEQQQRTMLDNLRMEVARLQPVRMSAHRRPRIHIPESLQAATHVFVRRGGTNPSLSSPYVGPFRVVSRQANSYRIAIPGSGNESVSIARLKPAFLAEDEEGVEEPEDPVPPSPPRPGRRPGPRTRQPAPTDRHTRSQPTPIPVPTPTAPVKVEPNESEEEPPEEQEEPTSGAASSGPVRGPPGERNSICVPESTQTTALPDPGPITIPPATSENPGGNTVPRRRLFSNPRRGHFSYGHSTAVPRSTADVPATSNPRGTEDSAPRRQRLFSNPQPGDFSYRRISYAAPLAAILKQTLGTK